MSSLEEKLSTLRDGAEAVSLVMRNWEGVLGVIVMAGQSASTYASTKAEEGGEDENWGREGGEGKVELPVTLVRIPVEGKSDLKEEAGG